MQCLTLQIFARYGQSQGSFCCCRWRDNTLACRNTVRLKGGTTCRLLWRKIKPTSVCFCCSSQMWHFDKCWFQARSHQSYFVQHYLHPTRHIIYPECTICMCTYMHKCTCWNLVITAVMTEIWHFLFLCTQWFNQIFTFVLKVGKVDSIKQIRLNIKLCLFSIF